MNCHLPLFLICFATLFGAPLLAQTPTPASPPPTPKQFDRSLASPRAFSSPCGRHVDVCDVLDQYASLTNFKIIRNNFVQGQISIDDVMTLPPEKAIQIIERSLFGDGFAIIQIAPDTVQIVGVGVSARTIGVPVVSDPKDVPLPERVISYLFVFKYRSAVEMQRSETYKEKR